MPSAIPGLLKQPMINLQNLAEERPMSLPEAASHISKITGGKKPNLSTIWRWCLRGCKGVTLESICIGGKRYVTVFAIERFIEARSRNEPPATPTAVTATSHASPYVERHAARRRAEIEDARRRLDEVAGTSRYARRSDASAGASRSAGRPSRPAPDSAPRTPA
jgi:hypothetical protein